MGGTKSVVRLRGVLKGGGTEMNCTVRAIKVELPGTNVFQYAQMTIEDTAGSPTEGVYDLHVAGQVHKVRRTAQGFWIAA